MKQLCTLLAILCTVAGDRIEANVLLNVHVNDEHYIFGLKFLTDLQYLLGAAQDVRHQQYLEGYHDLAGQMTGTSIFVARVPGLGTAGTRMAGKVWADIVDCMHLAVSEQPPRLAHFLGHEG